MLSLRIPRRQVLGSPLESTRRARHMATATVDTQAPVLAGGNSITHTAGTGTVRSATSRSNLVLSGGTSAVAGTDGESLHAPVSLWRGTVADAKHTAGSTLTLTSSGGNLRGDVTAAAIAILDATEKIDGGQDDVYATRDLNDYGLPGRESAGSSPFVDLCVAGSQTRLTDT